MNPLTSVLTRCFAGNLFARSYLWTLQDSDEELFEILEHTERSNVPERSGELCTFANDLESRYGNKSGRMCFTVKRVG